jgi:ribosomal protein L40E
VKTEPLVEICLRCGAKMEWRHATWQCPRCALKLGCCEGDCGEE